MSTPTPNLVEQLLSDLHSNVITKEELARRIMEHLEIRCDAAWKLGYACGFDDASR